MRDNSTIISLGSRYTHIDFDIYILYTAIISQYFFYMPVGGLGGDGLFLSNLENGLKLISANNGMGLNTIEWMYSSDSKKILFNMKKMLQADMLVVYSNFVLSDKRKLTLYKKDLSGEYLDSGIYVKEHFMNATGIKELSSDAAKLVGHSKMIKTSTYGMEYYIDFDEYADELGVATNMLYVKK